MKALKIILCLYSCLLSAEIHHQYTLPNNPDELGQLYIRSDENFDQISLPQINSLTWLDPSINYRNNFFNRNATKLEIIIPFKVSKTGNITIPAFTLGSHKIPTIDFKVGASPYDEAYFMKSEIVKESPALYPGQHFRINVELYIDTNYATQGILTAPLLSSEGLKFRQFSNRSSSDQRIENVERNEVQINGKTYRLIRLSYLASALINGEYDLTVDHNTRLIKRSGTPGANRAVALQRQVKLAKIKIKTLPPPPPGAINTSLVGQWKLSSSLDRKESKVGTPFTLKFTFNGKDGDPERFNIAQQDFKYFRLLSEDRKIEYESLDNLSASKSFVLAALGSDVVIPQIKFASFNPVKEKYDILQAELPSITFIGDKFKEPSAPVIKPRHSKNLRPEEIQLEENIKLPILSNVPAVLFVLASLLILAFLLKNYTHLQLSPRAQREKRLRQIRRLLKKASPEKTQMIYKDHLIPLLKQIHSLPLGDSNTQLIENISKKDLQMILRDFENKRFQAESDKPLSGKNLSRALKGLSFLFIFFLPLSNQAQELKTSAEYIKLLETEPENITYTFNAARAFKEEKQYALAYAYCQRLHRMAPRVDSFKELEQELSKQLKLKPLTRPILRPDEIWTIASYLLILTFFILCAFRKCPKAITFSLLLITACCLIYSYQLTQTYWHEQQYMVITKDCKAFPQVNSKTSQSSLVDLKIYRAKAFSSQRILLTNDLQEVWIERKDLFKVW